MVIIQRVLKGTGSRTYTTSKVGGELIGFEIGLAVEIYQKGDLLFFSSGLEYIKGFEFLRKGKVFSGQSRGNMQIPAKWKKEYIGDDLYIKVIYTPIGIFIKPYKGEFKNYVR